jgi:hypothetical protein
MVIVFNLVLVALAGLIAYWWANQGFFSSLLHFICVVAAGAIAFAVWEPLTVNYLLKGGWFDEYAWGVTLLSVFVVSLFLLRLMFDRVVPDNVNLPTWANYVFGGIFGIGAGVLTVGICMIGFGFMQSSNEIMGFRGHVRDSQFAGQPGDLNKVYPPMHTLTTEFYSALSGGALAPTFTRTSMKTEYPNLDEVAFSLWRDGFASGEGKSSINPNGASVDDFLYAPQTGGAAGTGGGGMYGALVTFQKDAFDRGEMLIVSSSQVRLIGRAKDGSSISISPSRWSQMTLEGQGEFPFDDVTHYASSLPGATNAMIFFMFPAKDLVGGTPLYLQIKGLRFKLPPMRNNVAPTEWALAKSKVSGQTVELAFDKTAPFADEGEIKVDNGIAPLTLSMNMVSGFEVVDQYLASGRSEFPREGQFNPGKALRIRGILEPAGTKIVKVDISRNADKAIDFWGDRSDLRSKAGPGAIPLLVAADGRSFQPIGYFWLRSDKAEIKLDPAKPIKGLSDIPQISAAGTDKLFLIYSVTEGARLINFTLGVPQKDAPPKGSVLANTDITVGMKEESSSKGTLTAP